MVSLARVSITYANSVSSDNHDLCSLHAIVCLTTYWTRLTEYVLEKIKLYYIYIRIDILHR